MSAQQALEKQQPQLGQRQALERKMPMILRRAMQIMAVPSDFTDTRQARGRFGRTCGFTSPKPQGGSTSNAT